MTNLTLHHEHNGTHIRDEKGGLVASLEAGSQEKRDRDGAQIVRDRNAHDALIKAVKDMAYFIENVTDDDPERQDKFFAVRESWRAALAKGEA